MVFKVSTCHFLGLQNAALAKRSGFWLKKYGFAADKKEEIGV
jgi:hypothetical protein